MDRSTDELRIQLLGGLQVSVSSRPVHESEWRLRKTKSLIKLLALARGHQLHREQLMELLWPEQDSDAAANNLHKALYTARRALEPHLPPATPSAYLHLQGDLLVLRSPGLLWIDVDAFAQAAAAARRAGEPRAYHDALQFYTGDLLPEDRYEDWATGRREELQALHVTLLLELARLHEALNEPAAAIEALRRVVASDPAHEEAHVALMRLHALTGHRHQALRQYQRLRDALRRELEVDPAPASQQTYREIVAGRWVPPRGATGLTLLGENRSLRGVGGAAEAREPSLVGRDAELEFIEDALEAVFAGHGRLVLVAGEAGIGKSRLATEVATRVRRRGGTALLGAAYEQEGRLPYGPFVEALEPVGGAVAPGGLRALFGDAASDLARLTASTTSAVRADRQRLFAAIAELLRRGAAESPVLLALDDLHAADEASLQLLHYLARTTRHCSILLLGTLRPEEAPPASLLGQLIGTLRREQLAMCLDLRRLNLPESGLLVATLLEGGPVDREVVEMIHRVAAGNPFYTEELLRTLRESGWLAQVDGRWRLLGEDLPLPRHVLELLSGRLERLGSDAAQVLNVAAVVGSETSYPLLRAATGLPLATLLNALDACLASRVLSETPDGYRFGHPLQRAALYERLSLARRMSLHGSVAAALEELHADGLECQAEALAHHWPLSEVPGRAVMHLLRAGDRAADVHANEVAMTAYRRALDHLGAPGAPERRAAVAAELWEKLGDLRALAGDAPQDEASYRAAIAALAPELEVESDRLARLHRKAAYAAQARHDVDAAALHLSAAESVLEGSTESLEWGRVRLVRALWLWAQGCHAEGRAAAEESLALARQHGEGLDLINAYMTLALVFHSSGEWKEGLQFEIQHIGAAADADPRLGLLFDAHACLGEYHLYGDTSFEALEAYARHTLEIAARVGARRAQAVAWLLLGEALLLRGCWGEAAPCLQQSLELQRSVGSTAGQAFALQRLAELCVYRGDLAAAEVHLQQALGLAIDPPMAPHVFGRIFATAALSALERADAPAAGRLLDRAAEVAERSGDCATCSALLHPVATRTYVALGDLTRAEHHVAAAEKVAAYWESGAWRAMAEMAHATVLGARADHARAVQRFLTAAHSFEQIGQRFDAARCLFEAAQASAEGGAVADARGLMGRALAVFEALGAAVAAEQARQQLTLPLPG